MGRFESPVQVVALFLAASVVSIGLIFFLNAEAHSRLHQSERQQDEHISTHSDSTPHFSYLTQEGSHHPSISMKEHNMVNGDNNNINQDKDNNEVAGDSAKRSSSRLSSVEINDASLPASLSPSSSFSSELTSKNSPEKASNYENHNTSSSVTVTMSPVSPALSTLESASPSAVLVLGSLMLQTSNKNINSSNVTLLNFLEDGLEKLLSLIKHAKNTYKSYYKKKRNKEAKKAGTEDYGTNEVVLVKAKSDGLLVEDGDSLGGGNINYGTKQKRRRRKKREILEDTGRLSKATNGMKMVVMIKNGTDAGGRTFRRSKRAVTSALTSSGNNGRRGRVGENEPYYWQMLEDNDHHPHQRNNNQEQQQKESSAGSQQQQQHYSYSQYPHYSQTHNHHHQHSHNNPNQYQQLSETNSHYHQYAGPRSIHPGQNGAPAVASAFTGEKVASSSAAGASSGTGINHGGISNPTSDFHKIRHAMNKLGGGGLDISVVERMILDTKSSRGGIQKSTNNNNNKSPPTNWDIKSHQHNNNHNHDDYSSSSSNSAAAALLTTATTKTTHPGRQDEGLFVNQLRNQQQQLAQSLLPPTVTWLSNENGGGNVQYLPLPGSSLATGGDEDDDDDDDRREKSNNRSADHDNDDNSNDVDNEEDEDSNENSVAGPSSKKKMKRRKSSQTRKPNNELSYSQKSSSSSSIIEKDGGAEDEYRSSVMRSDEEYYPFPFVSGKEKFTSEEEEEDAEQHNNNDSDNNNSRHNSNEDDIEMEDYNDEVLLGGEGSHHHHQKKKQKKGTENHSHYPPGKNGHQDCYHTDDVLIVVAITCCLNFAFVLVIWALVRWFSISSNPKEKDFQNLGDCDDTMDPTIVFHGVAEDPCWTLAGSGKERAAAVINSGGGVGACGMLSTRNCDGGAGPEGVAGTLRSIHSSASNKVDLFPTIGKIGGGIGASLQNTNYVGGGSLRNGGVGGGATVMAMTMDRDRGALGGYHSNYHAGGGAVGILGGGGGLGSSFVMNGMYSFRPEHVPTHHSSNGGSGMVRSYSQSMEDLRYLQ